MAIIDIDKMFWEMKNVMLNNFKGTPAQRYSLAKKQYLEEVADCIEQNKKELIEEVKESMGE